MLKSQQHPCYKRHQRPRHQHQHQLDITSTTTLLKTHQTRRHEEHYYPQYDGHFWCGQGFLGGEGSKTLNINIKVAVSINMICLVDATVITCNLIGSSAGLFLALLLLHVLNRHNGHKTFCCGPQASNQPTNIISKQKPKTELQNSKRRRRR